MKNLFFCFALFSSQHLSAQNNAEINGKVMDAFTGEALEFASVALYQNGTQLMGTITETNGAFLFKPLASGTYNIAVSYVGYGLQWFENIELRSGSLIFMECALQSGMLIDTVIHIYANKLVMQTGRKK